jgi:ABC-type transport system involved in multi-copper enzyme maturation permease subunit
MPRVLPLGPVFEREWAGTARQRRFYALRSAYGLGLMTVLLASGRMVESPPDPGSISGVWFAALLLRNLLFVQGLVVVFLTPALVAGTIAQEYQKRTLHELLASDLTSAEIVIGKLLARLAHAATLLAVGLPLLLVTGRLGGVDPSLVLAALGATLTTAFFLGSLSILASTRTRSVRGAMNLTFTLTLTWLILPAAIDVLLPIRGGGTGRALHAWVGPVNTWIAATSPFSLGIDALRGAIGGAAALRARVVRMIALQALYGVLMTALAVGSLRPSFRARLEHRGRRTSREAGPAARRLRPACGDDPMLWKELLGHPPRFHRPLAGAVVLILGGLLVWLTTTLAAPAFAEVWTTGYVPAPAGSARVTFQSYLRIVGTGIALVYLLGVASDSAASLTSEREHDTWISLIATPLSGTEIIRAKMLGAIWNIRHTALVLSTLWLLGVLVGSVHPLGLVAGVAELAAYTWLTAALGTWISLRARHTMQAIGRTMASLLVVSGGSLLVTLPVMGIRPLSLTACGPLVLAFSLASAGDLQGQPASGSFAQVSDALLAAIWAGRVPEMVLTCLASTLSAALGAWVLTRSACRGFDACLDRPALAGPATSAPDATSVLPSRPRTRLRSLRHAVNCR